MKKSLSCIFQENNNDYDRGWSNNTTKVLGEDFVLAFTEVPENT